MASQKQKLEKLLIHPEVKSWLALMGAFRAIYSSLEKALLIEHCSIPRFQILFCLYFKGPQSQAAIAKILFVTRGNISAFFKRLELLKLIQKATISKSHKRPSFCLTRKGITYFETLFPQHIRRVRSLMPILRPHMINVLQKIIERRSL